MTINSNEPELGLLRTEQVDAKFQLLDVMSISELLQAMNESDTEVPRAVNAILPRIEKAIDEVVDRMMQGGRLIYLGAGTSGRLGVLDAAECGPTFSVSTDQVVAFIAGGDSALRLPAEGAEDRPHWMGRVDYSGLKIKLIGSLVAISVIELLKDFMLEGEIDGHREGWRIGIHLTFVFSGVLFAVMDFIADKREAIDLSNEKEMIRMRKQHSEDELR